ncbi:MAG TPA: PP2C family protein-serine/threonine phosphatase [Tepidisphaeraceae bacterium]|nr:PP2C family protein-serine/threonine phosphatase [Tepidisphaeraceae bacterium]
MPDSNQHMQCMEIWGGNQPFDNSVVMSGLDAWVYSKPYNDSEGGGDVYYVSACATGRIARLLLADVSGHGNVVAQTARGLRRLMQRYVNFIDQTAFVREMNRQFAEMSGAGVFATAVVSTFFAPTNELTLCIAGHPLPMIYRAKEKHWSLWNEGDSGNIPLGIDDISEWSQVSARLSVGDLVLCYTDSLIESRGPDGEFLGTAGLLKIVQGLDISDEKQIIPNLLKAVGAQAEGNLAADDVTVLLFRPNGSATAAPFLSRAFAPIRVLGAAIQSLVSDTPAPWPEFNWVNLGGAMFKPLSRLRSRKSG